MSFLESDLNSKIQETNARKKEDADTTMRELANIKERVTKKLIDVSKRRKDHDTGQTLLHEGQMHFDHNLKILMTKMGAMPSNTLPSDAPEKIRCLRWSRQ